VNRRVLIIGHPFVGVSMGSVRLRRIAKWLPRHGWEPVVLSAPRDATATWQLDPGVRLEEIAAPDLTHYYQRLRRPVSSPAAPGAARPQPTAKEIGFTSLLNRWVMIPDKQLPWHRPAVRRGRELLRSEKFSAIFASIEPRTTALVGAQLARETGVPLVIEYRDLWTSNPYYHITQPTALHCWIHARLERRALRQARRVSAVCRGIAEYLTKAQGTALPGPVALNYNFFDADEYPPPAPTSAAPRPFTISYTGAMYASRTPHQFFEGMRAFINRARLSPEQFRFSWAGSIAGIPDLDAALNRTGVRPFIEFLGQIPHRDALRHLLQSDAALLIQAPGDAIHIPGKLFETMGAGVPLFALAHPCEVTEIIERCRAGLVCPYSTEDVVATLEQFHRRFQQGQRWDFAADEVSRFSADAAVGGLAKLFAEVSQ